MHESRRIQLLRSQPATETAVLWHFQAGAPDRQTILKAIKNLQGLWEHLTMGERSRLMSQLVANIDHDPTNSTLSITLSPLGLKSFATNNPEHSPLQECKKS